MIDITLRKRMLVAVDGLQDMDLLELAASLAGFQDAQLSALFVEDIDLFHLAGLPFASEIDRMTSAEMQFDPLLIRVKSERQLRRLRKCLGDIEKQSNLSVSLQVVRGRYLNEALAAAGGVDLLLFAKTRKPKAPARPSQTGGKPRYVSPVWVVFNGSESSARALKLAAEIAVSRHASLNVLFDLASGRQLSVLEKQARQLLGDCPASCHFFAEQGKEYDSILQYIRQRGCCIALMSAVSEEPEDLKRTASLFAERAACPVLLVT